MPTATQIAAAALWGFQQYWRTGGRCRLG